MRRIYARLSAIVLLVASVCHCSVSSASGEDPGPPRVILSTPVTHSDWMVHKPAPSWGPEGVHQILDRCRACGIQRVYWRCFDGGRATYPSRLLEPLHGFDEDNYHRGRDSAWVLDVLKQYDFGSFDAFREAISYGHRIGVEVHAWLTINEDDHGWGLASRFARENPDSRWVRRDGRAFQTQQSFAFPKVRAYKLALLKEVLAYHPDGIFFDWIRTGDTRDNPHTDGDGVAIYGYEAPNLEAFQRKYGLDPRTVANSDARWVRLRAEPQTVFMREAAALMRKSNPKIPIVALVQQPWGYRGLPNDTPYKDCLSGLLLDVEKWATEGLVDTVIGAGYYRPGGNAETACRWLQEQTRGKTAVGLYGWIATPEQFRADTQLAEKLHAHELLLWESDYLELPPARPELVKLMAGFSARRHPATRPASKP